MKQRQLAKAIKQQMANTDMKGAGNRWQTPSSTMKAAEIDSEDDSVIDEHNHSNTTQQQMQFANQ